MYERQKGTDWSTLSQEMNQPRNTKIQYHRKCGDNIFLANLQSLLNICSILFFCLSMVTIKVSNAGISGFKREVKPRFIIFWFSENFVSTNYLFGNNVAAYWPAITKCTLKGRIQTIHYLQGLFSIFSLPLSSSLKNNCYDDMFDDKHVVVSRCHPPPSLLLLQTQQCRCNVPQISDIGKRLWWARDQFV